MHLAHLGSKRQYDLYNTAILLAKNQASLLRKDSRAELLNREEPFRQLNKNTSKISLTKSELVR